MSSDSKSQAHIHPTGVPLHWRVDEFLHLGESHDLIKLPVKLRLLHPQDSTTKINVFSPGQFGMEACTNLKKTSYPAVNLGATGGGFSDAREDFEQGGLTGAIAADDAYNFTAFDLKTHVLQSPDV